MTILSPLLAAQAELAADAAVQGIVGLDAGGTRRVRIVEPQATDALGAGKYIPFVVLSILDQPWQATTGTSAVSLGLRCYGASYPAAEALYLACAAVFHRKGGRIAASRLGIYSSLTQGGGTPDKDKDTLQPLFWGVITLNVSTQAIPS